MERPVLELYDEDYNADAILALIKPETKTIILDNMGLGDDDLCALIAGFDHLRKQYSNPVDGDWGMQQIVFEDGEFTDKGLAAIGTYLAVEGRLRSLYLSHSFSKTMHNLDGLIHSLNSSHLTDLSLSYNKLHPSAAVSFLRDIRSTSLRRLYLTDCHLAGPEITDAVVSFLGSHRSRYLSHLRMNRNDFLPDLRSVRHMIDTIKAKNFALERLDVHFGILPPHVLSHGPEVPYTPFKGLPSGDAGEMMNQWQRLDRYLKRNVGLTRRAQKAALRCLPAARIILNDRFLAGVRSSARQRSNKTNPQSSAAAHATTPRFRLLDLPPDLINLIVRHTSGDATALSHAQYARIRIDALGKDGLRRVMKAAKDGKTARYTVWGDTKVGSKEEWLESLGLSKWEKDVYDD